MVDIIVLKKNKPDNRVCFIDASNEFVHEGNKNKLSNENIEKIYDTQFNKTEVEYFSKVVTTAEIEAHKFNLSVSTYVEKENTSVEVDKTTLSNNSAGVKLFMLKYIGVMNLPDGISSESAGGLSQSFGNVEKDTMLMQIARSLFGDAVTMGKVRFAAAQNAWA